MLSRVLEPESMDSLEESMAYDDMDHAEVNRCFVRDLMEAAAVAGEVLDLGTGTGRIPIELCQHSEEVRVMAVDLSIYMLDIAKINVELASLTHQIMLDRIDAKALPYEDDRFAAVISNSIVHHIPEPLSTVQEAVRVCQPGGLLFFRDLLRPSDQAELERLVDTYAVVESERGQQLFADSLRAALTIDEMRTMVEQCGFPAETVQATSDRHWTWQVIK